MRGFFSRSCFLKLVSFCSGLVFFLSIFILVPVVHAALPRDAYQASLLSISAPSTLAPEETAQVRIEFQNIGTTAWLSSGKNFVSLYRWDPSRKVELASELALPNWETPTRPLRLPQARLEPGKSLTFSFSIKAPKQPGVYTETFILTAEDMAWMKYGQATVKLEVRQRPTELTSQPQVYSPLPVSTSFSSTAVSNQGEWAAELVQQSGREWQLDPEGTSNITLSFRNVGTKTWTRDQVGFLSLYSTNGANQERTSSFKGSLWNGNVAARLKEVQVPPGQIGTFMFQIQAPRTAGSYQESFSLAAEKVAWVKGGTVTLPIRVLPSSVPEFIATGLPDGVVPLSPAVTEPTRPTAKRTASLLIRSFTSLTLLGNGRQELQVGYKNTGDVVWNSRALRVKGVVPASTARWASIRDDSWLSAAEPVRTLGDVKPGEIAFLTFKLKAPAKKGTYTASFALYADGERVEGGDIDIPITVTADGYIEPEPEPAPAPRPSTPAPPSTSSPSPAPLVTFPAVDPVPLSGDAASLPNEPMIRVGIYRTTDDRMVVRSMRVPVIVSQNGTTICRLNSGESAAVVFDRTNRVYKLSGGSCAGQSTQLYVFKSEDGIAPMEIADFSRPVGWLPGANDNTFRAQLELRYTPATDGVWVINELPVEWYLKGIAETSNVSPPEFQRTLLVTARTYAMYHVQRGTKHADEFYTVDAKYDQVYRGYGSEARGPNIVAAVDATRGQIVTYQGKLAITPYFSRSDGRTRSWGEVWYGGSQYPWLVGVPVPQDQGKTLWGHGVGMSASGALAMANEGRRYDEILTYFYRGIELRKAYK